MDAKGTHPTAREAGLLAEIAQLRRQLASAEQWADRLAAQIAKVSFDDMAAGARDAGERSTLREPDGLRRDLENPTGMAPFMANIRGKGLGEGHDVWQLSTDIMLVAQFDGVIRAVNPAWASVLGWTKQDLIDTKFFELVHPDDLERTKEGAKSLSEGNTLWRFDNRYRRKEGGYRWIAWTAIPGGGFINAVGRDFTPEKERMEALELSEARMRSVFETSYQFQGLLTTDGILLDANPTSLAAIEARLEDVVGKPFWETPWFTGTAGMPQQVQTAIPVVATGEMVSQEIVVNLPTGRRAFDFSMRPVLNTAGDVIAIVPEAMELTERRAAEEQLRQAQKMEAVGQLTGGIAHDFNNLLTGIAGSLELLKARMAQELPGDAERYITAAQSATSRAAALTHRLLAFSRRQTLDPKPMQVNKLIAGMEELIQRTVGPEIKVETVLSLDLWWTLCDSNQLESAMLNLCINARDAMPDGGRLTIETANIWVDELAARARDMTPGQYVVIYVTDTGTGMEPDVVLRAFDPFFTTKPMGMGTGLGLSMIYGFARQSGGQVRISSKVGSGTTIRMYLPRYFGATQEEEAPETLSAAPRAADGETVLVVDDEPMVRMLVVDVLEGLGYTAIEAADGASGLKVLQTGSRIDLLITDVGLPGGMNGRQMADAARQTRPELKVLFITGYAESAVIGNCQLAPGMQVITKPFAIDKIADRIKAMVTGNV
jgi:PAS domain S-box-containing protein